MMAKQEPIGLLLASLRRRQRQAVEIRVRDLDLSTQQFWLLVALRERQGSSLADILAALPMDQPTASRVLAALCRRKLVRLDNDPADRRRRRLVLTTKGLQFSERCLVVAVEFRQTIEANFSSEDLATLRRWLQRIVANLDELDRTSPPGQSSSKKRTRPARARANDKV